MAGSWSPISTNVIVPQGWPGGLGLAWTAILTLGNYEGAIGKVQIGPTAEKGHGRVVPLEGNAAAEFQGMDVGGCLDILSGDGLARIFQDGAGPGFLFPGQGIQSAVQIDTAHQMKVSHIGSGGNADFSGSGGYGKLHGFFDGGQGVLGGAG
jgi:hypothetical protein